MLVPLVISGGSGTRLWPLSRPLAPKQLLPLVAEATMLQQTTARVVGLEGVAPPVVVCNAAHGTVIEQQLAAQDLPAQAIVLEPFGRNTAPAVALAALRVARTAPEALLLVLPADHVVLKPEAFRAAVARGIEPAGAGKLVTFGVVPDRPETGYGYILGANRDAVAPIERFVEKPDLATAEQYLAAGGYYWNSGIFLFGAQRYVDELQRFNPAMVDACRAALEAATVDGALVAVDPEAFAACPSDSIDYAVMEKTEDGIVVAMDAGWSDVGSWSALHGVREQDGAGNVAAGDVVAVDCEGSFFHSSHRLVTAVGLRDTIVVETEDAILVADKARSQDVRAIVDRLKADDRQEAVGHRTRATPFGSQRRVEDIDGATVWHLAVDPGREVSTDAPCDRRLVVVRGAGSLTRDAATTDLTQGDVSMLAAGERYTIHNGSDAALHLVAVDLATPRS
ncbi:MAG: mannose-1-phosphate guanylyltransferase/mannose-6-phosphate isomerase [Myxococcota bacterium]